MKQSCSLSLSILDGMESTRKVEVNMGASIDREDAKRVSSEALQNKNRREGRKTMQMRRKKSMQRGQRKTVWCLGSQVENML